MVNTQAGDALITNNDSDNGTNALEAIVEEMGTVSTTDLKAAPSHAPLRAIITGAPASGKGTQCERIVGAYGMVHLSTGDMLRAAVTAGTALGAQADGWMKSGGLVPDELIISIITERLGERDCVEKGWLLDGFPRTAVQAEALAAAGLVPDCVLELDVPEESLIDRVVSRRLDPVSGAIYNVRSKMPTDPEVLARLVQRADDTEETARKRLAAYRANLEALRAAYPGMVRLDGACPADAVFRTIADALDGVQQQQQQQQQTSPEAAAPVADGSASPEAIGAAPAPSRAPLRAIITGAPASGKGTQCERIVGAYGMVHLSTGDMLRAAVTAGTALGAQADGWMKSGGLVPDELIISIITERLGERDCVEKGWLLDGFPRTAVQAEALAAAGLVPDCVLELDVPEESLIDRVVSRRLDPVSGAIYNVRSKMPTDPEVLARLVQRADDTEETARKRLAAYRANLEALRAAYPGMVRLDGACPADAVFRTIADALDGVQQQQQQTSS